MATVEARPTLQMPFVRVSRRLELGTIACTILLGIVIIVVVYPLVLLLINSFRLPSPTGTVYSLANWYAAIAEPGLNVALLNTLRVAVVVQVISLPLAILFAWVIARTDMPGAEFADFLFWIAYFMPNLVITAGWICWRTPTTVC